MTLVIILDVAKCVEHVSREREREKKNRSQNNHNNQKTNLEESTMKELCNWNSIELFSRQDNLLIHKNKEVVEGEDSGSKCTYTPTDRQEDRVVEERWH